MKESRKAKFYCENCGAEVPESAKFCKYCGRFFSSVRCPNCGATGSSSRFSNGCPECGYAANGTSTSVATAGKINSSFQLRKKKRQDDSPLPVWIYLLTVLALAVIIALVVMISS